MDPKRSVENELVLTRTYATFIDQDEGCLGGNGWEDGCVDGWMSGWMEIRMDGRTDI